MDRAVVAVFDGREQAEAAWQDVVACGVAEDLVHLHAGSLDDVPGSHLAEAGIRRAGWGDGLDDEHNGHYREALRRGCLVVAVDPIPDALATNVAAALERHAPVELGERVAAWREQGWTGFNPSAPPFSEDEVAADRALHAQRGGRRATASAEDTLPGGTHMMERGGVRIYSRTLGDPTLLADARRSAADDDPARAAPAGGARAGRSSRP